jgi:thioredoxin 1
LAIVLGALLLIITGCGGEPEGGRGRGERASGSVTGEGLPHLIDVGRDTCVPCKMMKPILEELEEEYRGRVRVEMIDLRRDQEAAERYGVRLIPTQILFDSGGKEVWRHEGFISKEDIVAELADMGVEPGDR